MGEPFKIGHDTYVPLPLPVLAEAPVVSLPRAVADDNRVPRRRRVGGRTLKNTPKARHSSIKAKTGLILNFDDRAKRKRSITASKDADKRVRDMVKKDKLAKKEHREKKRKIKEENEKKSLVYQKISNTSRIKKMSRKQLKSIQKM